MAQTEADWRQMKYSLTELKKMRNKLARHIIDLEEALYIAPNNEELRADLEDAKSEYEYVSRLIAQHDPFEIEWDKAFNHKYGN